MGGRLSNSAGEFVRLRMAPPREREAAELPKVLATDESFNREMLADDVNIHTTMTCEMANFYQDAHHSLRTSAH